MVFPSGKDVKAKGLAAPSNLSMNQSLEGHNGMYRFAREGICLLECMCEL